MTRWSYLGFTQRVISFFFFPLLNSQLHIDVFDTHVLFGLKQSKNRKREPNVKRPTVCCLDAMRQWFILADSTKRNRLRHSWWMLQDNIHYRSLFHVCDCFLTAKQLQHRLRRRLTRSVLSFLSKKEKNFRGWPTFGQGDSLSAVWCLL